MESHPSVYTQAPKQSLQTTSATQKTQSEIKFHSLIVSQKNAGASGRILSFALDRSYLPGQVVGLSMGEKESPRWYSLSSPPSSTLAEVLYTKVEDGFLTPRLWDLDADSGIWVRGPRGSFTDNRHDEKRWWVANGTGIAPFASMVGEALRGHGDSASAMRESLSKRVLIHGCRSIEDAYYRELFDEAAQNHGLTYILCISGGKVAGEKVRGEMVAGRMTVWLRENWSVREHPSTIMLCGSSGMISDVRELLLEQTFPYENIVTEVYF